MLRGAIILCLLSGLTSPCLADDGDADADATGNGAAISCQTAGYDLILTNSGDVDLPEGTEIAWAVRFARVEGVHMLSRTLEPGKRVVIVAATDPSYLTTDTPCTVELRVP